MKKVLLSTAIAAAMGVSGFAQAAVDLREDAADRDVNVYAAELTIGQGGLNIASGMDELDVLAQLGFGVAPEQRRFIRLDLSGASVSFSVAPDVIVSQQLVDENGDLLFQDAALTMPATVDITATASQGGVNENFYIVEFTAPVAGDVTVDATALFVSDGMGGSQAGQGTAVENAGGLAQNASVLIDDPELNVESAESVSISYKLYETAVDAANNAEANELASASGLLAGFENALVVAAGPVNTVKRIDVTKESVLFDSNMNDDVSDFGELVLSLADGDPETGGIQLFVRNAAGDIITQLDELIDPANTTAVVSGDFSSAVSLANNGAQIAIADLLNDDGDAVFEVAGADLAADSKPYTFEYLTDGETAIPEAQFQLTANLDSVAGFTLPESVGPINLNQFEKNGSTTVENMTLDPNGAFRNFVRISNTSGVEGRVFVTIINDDGESESFRLSDVSVGADTQPATLAAQASTRLIPMSAFVAAAQAQNSAFDVVNAQRNKFRLVIDGEFPTISSDNVTLATDNTTFSTF